MRKSAGRRCFSQAHAAAVITGLIGARRVAELGDVLTDLRAKIILDGAGHWVQQERPDEVNAALIDFLKA